MMVKDAKNVARQWVIEEACKLPGFYGAFHHGSTNWLPDNTALPATSDVDVMVVIADVNLPDRLGIFNYRGVILDVTYVPNGRPVEFVPLLLYKRFILLSWPAPAVQNDGPCRE